MTAASPQRVSHNTRLLFVTALNGGSVITTPLLRGHNRTSTPLRISKFGRKGPLGISSVTMRNLNLAKLREEIRNPPVAEMLENLADNSNLTYREGLRSYIQATEFYIVVYVGFLVPLAQFRNNIAGNITVEKDTQLGTNIEITASKINRVILFVERHGKCSNSINIRDRRISLREIPGQTKTSPPEGHPKAFVDKSTEMLSEQFPYLHCLPLPSLRPHSPYAHLVSPGSQIVTQGRSSGSD
jgi:hypothetical protein